VRSSGYASTELQLLVVFRALGIVGWRRGTTVRGSPRPEGPSPKAAPLRAGAAVRAAGQAAKMEAFRVRPDFVFPARRLAVFVFWHGCSQHGTRLRQNARFWCEKIAHNQTRDRLVTCRLRAPG
jgi:hypothetical protein